jgi:hypothetical protein
LRLPGECSEIVRDAVDDRLGWRWTTAPANAGVANAVFELPSVGGRNQLALDAALAKAERDPIRSERLWEAGHLDDEPSRGSVD